jgi:predicted transcriptional regulator
MPQMLLPMFPGEATPINSLVSFCRRDGMVYYFNGMMPFFSHPEGDINAFRLITSQLLVNKIATQKDIVQAFGVSVISVKRYLRKYRQEGSSGFFKPRKGRGSTVLTSETLEKIQGYLNENRSIRSICEELCLKSDTLNKAIRDRRLHRVDVISVEKKSPQSS